MKRTVSVFLACLVVLGSVAVVIAQPSRDMRKRMARLAPERMAPAVKNRTAARPASGRIPAVFYVRPAKVQSREAPREATFKVGESREPAIFTSNRTDLADFRGNSGDFNTSFLEAEPGAKVLHSRKRRVVLAEEVLPAPTTAEVHKHDIANLGALQVSADPHTKALLVLSDGRAVVISVPDLLKALSHNHGDEHDHKAHKKKGNKFVRVLVTVGRFALAATTMGFGGTYGGMAVGLIKNSFAQTMASGAVELSLHDLADLLRGKKH